MGVVTEPGGETRRLELGAAVILYDPSRASNLQPAWFDLEYWQQRGAVLGRAGGRGTTWFVGEGEREFALRHYRRGGLAARVSADRYLYLGESRTRAAREWQVHRALYVAGLPVPAPIGVRIVREPFSYTADMLTARLADVHSLAQRLADESLPITEWIALGRCLRRFHDFGLDHADLNAHNILWGPHASIYLIDFDRGALRRRGLWCDANLVRLRRSLIKVTRNLPVERFTETDWQSLLAGYWQAGFTDSVAH